MSAVIPKSFIMVAWLYKPGTKHEELAWREDSYTSLVFVAKDMLSDELHDVAQVVYVDLERGISADWTNEAYKLVSEFSWNEDKEPPEAMRDELDARNLDYYADPERIRQERFWQRADDEYERRRDQKMEAGE